jgi:hypothetical protein
MRRLLTIFISVIAVFSAMETAEAKKTALPDWQDPQTVERNRLPMAA